jgi:hypothetical protein
MKTWKTTDYIGLEFGGLAEIGTASRENAQEYQIWLPTGHFSCLLWFIQLVAVVINPRLI